MSGEIPRFDDEEDRKAVEKDVERLADELETYLPLPALPSQPCILPPPDLPPASEN